jgi:hypothetical protein
MENAKNEQQCAIHDVSGMLRPREVAKHCPNCGKICWNSELNHSSTIKTAWGGSTLYGVCAECARIHSLQDESKDLSNNKCIGGESYIK